MLAHAKAINDVLHIMVGCIVASGHDKFTLTVELYTVLNLYVQA